MKDSSKDYNLEEVHAELASLNDKVKRSHDQNNKLIIELESKSAELLKMQEKLIVSEKLAAIGQLTAETAHEINNPLSVALMSIERILKKNSQELDQKILSKLETSLKSLLRIKDIVGGLRNYARQDKRGKEKFKLNEVIEETYNIMLPLLKKENIEVSFQRNETEVLVTGDRGQFSQVLVNFIQNAKDAMEKSSQKFISIGFELDSSGEVVTLSINDTGPGISKNHEEKIFEMFFTTKEVGKGTGMGLGISHQIITRMDGRLWLDQSDTKTQGACFKISLPVSEIRMKNEEKFKTKRKKNFTASPLEGSVLVIENNQNIIKSLELDMEEFKLDYRITSNLAEATELIKRDHFDIVLVNSKSVGLFSNEIEMFLKLTSNDQVLFSIEESVSDRENVSSSYNDKFKGKLTCPFSQEALYRKISVFLKPKDLLNKKVS